MLDRDLSAQTPASARKPVLVLEPYYGGSHKMLIEGLREHIPLRFELLTLPPRKWKWRMRHSAIYFAQQVEKLITKGNSWDILFCSDMMNLAEF